MVHSSRQQSLLVVVGEWGSAPEPSLSETHLDSRCQREQNTHSLAIAQAVGGGQRIFCLSCIGVVGVWVYGGSEVNGCSEMHGGSEVWGVWV